MATRLLYTGEDQRSSKNFVYSCFIRIALLLDTCVFGFDGIVYGKFCQLAGRHANGENKWYFRAFGLLTLAAALIIYLRRSRLLIFPIRRCPSHRRGSRPLAILACVSMC